MRAITVKQPWAWAITHGGKDIENRTWNTLHRGPLAIHAGARWDGEDAVARVFELTGAYVLKTTTSAVVAVVDLIDVCEVDDCQCGTWAIRFQRHWKLANPRPLAEPVPCRGRLGLWSLPEDVEAAVRDQLAAAVLPPTA
ncbi:ASCH domain-containing protein [Streptosporangium sandarakinum]